MLDERKKKILQLIIEDYISTHSLSFEEAVIHYSAFFDVLPAGTNTPFASEFVQSDTFKEFIES